MLVHQVTTGYVVQTFDTEKNTFISQHFVAGDECVWEDGVGNAIDAPSEAYLGFDMVQPDTMSTMPKPLMDVLSQNGFDPKTQVLLNKVERTALSILKLAVENALEDIEQGHEDFVQMVEGQRWDEKNGLYGGREDITN